MVRGLAQLGGFLARTGDGEPGIQAIWQGYQRLHEFIYALETHRRVNRAAYAGTAEAHREGGVPNFTLTLPGLDEASLGGALAFFQHAVAVGGYLLGVNPFDQPGVEAYKRKMFELLGQ
jgi:glucose-6-phosphate isomerase